MRMSSSCLARAGVVSCGLLAALASAPHSLAAEKKPPVCSRPIPELYEQASPAVVSIIAQSINPYRLQGRVSQSLGSGFIIQEDGLILTNSHVVFGKQSLVVTLDDGSVVPARLVGADPIFDVAVIQIPKPAKGTLPVLKLGDSGSLREGEDVIAIGNPLGLDQTVTRGIVSGLNRLLQDTPFSLQEPLIQTDAPINPGNSGGPLLNRCGEVIGINAEIIPSAQNIGFAIPIDLAKALLPALVSGRQGDPAVDRLPRPDHRQGAAEAAADSAGRGAAGRGGRARQSGGESRHRGRNDGAVAGRDFGAAGRRYRREHQWRADDRAARTSLTSCAA